MSHLTPFQLTSPNDKHTILRDCFAFSDYTLSQKICAKLFLLELRQISTNVDNFWQNDSKQAEIMRDALNFHLT